MGSIFVPWPWLYMSHLGKFNKKKPLPSIGRCNWFGEVQALNSLKVPQVILKGVKIKMKPAVLRIQQK